MASEREAELKRLLRDVEARALGDALGEDMLAELEPAARQESGERLRAVAMLTAESLQVWRARAAEYAALGGLVAASETEPDVVAEYDRRMRELRAIQMQILAAADKVVADGEPPLRKALEVLRRRCRELMRWPSVRPSPGISA